MSSDERGLQQLFEQLDRSKTGRIGAEELDFFLVIMGVHDATKRSAQVYDHNIRYTLRLLFISRLRKKKGIGLIWRERGARNFACMHEGIPLFSLSFLPCFFFFLFAVLLPLRTHQWKTFIYNCVFLCGGRLHL